MARPFKRYNISKVREVIQSDNTVKKFWDRVGKLVLFQNEDGTESGMLELITFDKSINLSVFSEAPKTQQTQAPQQNYQTKAPTQNQEKPVDDFDIPDEEIRVENIPF